MKKETNLSADRAGIEMRLSPAGGGVGGGFSIHYFSFLFTLTFLLHCPKEKSQLIDISLFPFFCLETKEPKIQGLQQISAKTTV